jgi:hypothetical protein
MLLVYFVFMTSCSCSIIFGEYGVALLWTFSSWGLLNHRHSNSGHLPLFPHLVPPAIMVWILVWKYIFEPFIHILQHFVLQLSRSTNFCFYVQLPFYWNIRHSNSGPPFFPHLVPPAIMVWILVWKYIFEPFIHILQHFVLQLSRSTNFCFQVQLPFYWKIRHPNSDRQYVQWSEDKERRTNKVLQNTSQKIKDRETRIH